MKNGIEINMVWLDYLTQRFTPERVRSALTDLMNKAAEEQAGDLRFIVSALAMINYVPVKYMPFRPNGSILSKGRLKPYLETRIVHIDLPTTRRRIKIIEQRIKAAFKEEQRRRHHDVRAHYRFSDTRHNERWELRFDPRRLRMRWSIHIPEHTRGDIALGHIDHEYDVRAKSANG